MSAGDRVRSIVWRRIYWSYPLDPDAAIAVLRSFATDQASRMLILEARSDKRGISYLVGGSLAAVLSAEYTLKTTVEGLRIVGDDLERWPVTSVRKIKLSTRHRAVRTDNPEQIARAVLAALSRVRSDEVLVVQTVLGPRRVPLAVPNHSPSSLTMSWWQVAWLGNGGEIDGEKRAALRAKVSDHGFAATVRLGAAAATKARRRELAAGLFGAIRLMEAPGLTLRLGPDSVSRTNKAKPPLAWPLRLGVSEILTMTAWPVGDGPLPGQPPIHPKVLAPIAGMTGNRRVVARSTAPGVNESLALPVAAALHHLHVLGPTGTGKSTLLVNLICQDMADGRSIVVVDPQGDLVRDVLARVPARRRPDVVVIDPSDRSAPVGLNPLLVGQRNPEVVADGMLAVFKGLYGEALGPRSTDILHSCLLTLTHRDDASLVMLPLLLTNAGFRRSMTAQVADPIALGPFWAWYEALSEGERQAAIAPIQNKLRQWLLRPSIRNVLGQRRPKFSMVEAMADRKVVLVSLAQQQLGPEGAALLGSLVVVELWQATQDRAGLPRSARRPVMVYLDEFSAFLHLPTDLADALARSRGMGVGYTLAHQFMSQLPPSMRSAVLANTRSRVCFQLSPEDAAVIARGAPELTAEDLTALGRYEVYASLFAGGRVSPFAAGRTLPAPQAIASTSELREASRSRYGSPLSEIEAGFAELIDSTDSGTVPTGRRPRRAS